MQHNSPITLISFPEISLKVRDAHKLRGFFGNYFREVSPLLHNHLAGGGLQYAYSLVQYKVLQQVPVLMGIQEGADLLRDLFLKIDNLVINEVTYPVYAKNIDFRMVEVGIHNQLYSYRFETLWMALNEENYSLYITYPPERQMEQLNGILIRNISNALKALGVKITPETTPIMAKIMQLQEKTTQFKGTKMCGFTGEFITNALLPDYLGLGKSVSRGFGVIKKT